MTMGQSQSHMVRRKAGGMAREISRILLATTMLGITSVFVPTVAFAQSQPAAAASQAIPFDIPPQSLASALDAFIRQSGWQITYSSALVRGKQSGGIQGNATAATALNRLVAGTGIAVTIGAPGSAALIGTADGVTGSVVGSDSTALDTITVEGENAWGPVNGVVATRSGSGTKTDTPIEKIPQTVNVVTAEEVRARASVTVAQALRYTPGINVNGFTDANKIADEVTARSFAPAPLYLDGAYLPYAGSLGGALQIDPYWLERIEVLKGPSSVLYGQNQPGGIINLVTKKPLDTDYREIKLGYDSNNQKEVGVDFSGPVNDEKTILYRFTGLAKGGQEQIEFTKSDRVFLAPSVTFKPDEDTSLTLFGSYQHDGGVPDYQPLPYIGSVVAGPDGKFIDRDLFTGEPGWNDFKRNQYVLGADLDHAFTDDIKLRSRVRYSDVRDDYKGFYLRY